VFHRLEFLKAEILCSRAQQNLHMYLNSLHILCATQILHCLDGYFFFPWQDETIFSSMCLLKSPDSLTERTHLGPVALVSLTGCLISPKLISAVVCFPIFQSFFPNSPILTHELC
jgi:hypothetical protein